MHRTEKQTISSVDERKKDNQVDLTRRAIIIGGASLLAGSLLGCGSNVSQITGNLYQGVDGRDYAIQPPTGPAKEISLEARLTDIEIAPNRIVKAWT